MPDARLYDLPPSLSVGTATGTDGANVQGKGIVEKIKEAVTS